MLSRALVSSFCPASALLLPLILVYRYRCGDSVYSEVMYGRYKTQAFRFFKKISVRSSALFILCAWVGGWVAETNVFAGTGVGDARSHNPSCGVVTSNVGYFCSKVRSFVQQMTRRMRGETNVSAGTSLLSVWKAPTDVSAGTSKNTCRVLFIRMPKCFPI